MPSGISKLEQVESTHIAQPGGCLWTKDAKTQTEKEGNGETADDLRT
jgi:hypothetical protein